MAGKDFVGILFGVKGGGQPSGESYKLINQHLQDIIDEINKNPKEIKLKINEEYLNSQIAKLQGTLNKLNLNADIFDDFNNLGEVPKNIEASYDRASAALNRYLATVKSASKYKASHAVLYDENYKLYEHTNKANGLIKKTVMEGNRYLQEFYKIISQLSDSESAELQKKLKDQITPLLSQFQKTSLAVETKLLNQEKEAERITQLRYDSAVKAIAASKEYITLLKENVELAEQKRVLYKKLEDGNKSFIAANQDDERAMLIAATLNNAYSNVSSTYGSSDITDAGKAAIVNSYAAEIKALMAQYTESEKTASNEAVNSANKYQILENAMLRLLAVLQQLNNMKLPGDNIFIRGFESTGLPSVYSALGLESPDKNAGSFASLLKESALQEYKNSRLDYEDFIGSYSIQTMTNGLLQIDSIFTKGFKGAEIEKRTSEIRDTVDSANRLLQEFFDAARGYNGSDLLNNDIFIQVARSLNAVTSPLDEATKKYLEYKDVILDSGRYIKEAYNTQLKSLKNIRSAYSDIAKLINSSNIASKYGKKNNYKNVVGKFLSKNRYGEETSELRRYFLKEGYGIYKSGGKDALLSEINQQIKLLNEEIKSPSTNMLLPGGSNIVDLTRETAESYYSNLLQLGIGSEDDAKALANQFVEWVNYLLKFNGENRIKALYPAGEQLATGQAARDEVKKLEAKTEGASQSQIAAKAAQAEQKAVEATAAAEEKATAAKKRRTHLEVLEDEARKNSEKLSKLGVTDDILANKAALLSGAKSLSPEDVAALSAYVEQIEKLVNKQVELKSAIEAEREKQEQRLLAQQAKQEKQEQRLLAKQAKQAEQEQRLLAKQAKQEQRLLAQQAKQEKRIDQTLLEAPARAAEEEAIATQKVVDNESEKLNAKAASVELSQEATQAAKEEVIATQQLAEAEHEAAQAAKEEAAALQQAAEEEKVAADRSADALKIKRELAHMEAKIESGKIRNPGLYESTHEKSIGEYQALKALYEGLDAETRETVESQYAAEKALRDQTRSIDDATMAHKKLSEAQAESARNAEALHTKLKMIELETQMKTGFINNPDYLSSHSGTLNAWKELSDAYNKLTPEARAFAESQEKVADAYRRQTQAIENAKAAQSQYQEKAYQDSKARQERERAVNLRLQELQVQNRINQLSSRDANYTEHYSKLVAELDRLRQEYNGLSAAAKRYAEENERVQHAQAMYGKGSAGEQEAAMRAEQTWVKARRKAAQFMNDYAYARSNSDFRRVYDEMAQAIQGTAKETEHLNSLQREGMDILSKNNLLKPNWWQKFSSTFGTRVRSMFAGLVLFRIRTVLRNIYTNVVEFDTAMTNLQIVTHENDTAMKKFGDTITDTAKRIGASVTDLVNSTTTYARLGFSLADSSKFAELTTAYSKVADVGADEATKNITGIIKAYNVNSDNLEEVIDKLIYVGRKYAISSGEIGEGMNNAASSLAANGNTFNQALGILTAANTTVQNISKSSTAVRTITARLTASKVDLDELGEETIEIPKLAAKFRAYGVEIEKGNGELYSTYEILDKLASKWDEYDDKQRKAIAELSSGTRMQDIFFSIMQNWGDAMSVVNNADQSSGELSRATAQRLESIQGHIDQLKASFQELSNTVLSGALVKTVVDALKVIVTGLSKITGFIDSTIGLNAALVAILGTLIAINVQKKLATEGSFLYKLKHDLLNLNAYLQVKRSGGILGGGFVGGGAASIGGGVPLLTGQVGPSMPQKFVSAFNTSALKTAGIIGLIVAAVAVLIKTAQWLDKRWKKSFDQYNEDLEKTKESISEHTKEIASLKDLRQRVEEAHNSKQKLSAIYEEVNKKIGASIGFINGEESAYRGVIRAIDDQIKAEEKLKKEEENKKVSYATGAFNNNALVRKETEGVLAGKADWWYADVSGEMIRKTVSGENNAFLQTSLNNINTASKMSEILKRIGLYDYSTYDLAQNFAQLFDYDVFNTKLTDSEREYVLSVFKITPDDWEEYWNTQVNIAKEVFASRIDDAEGIFGADFLNAVIDRLARSGHELSDIQSILDDINTDKLSDLTIKYYEALESGDKDKATELYKTVCDYVNELIKRFPVLTTIFTNFFGSITGPEIIDSGLIVPLKSVFEILDEVQDGFDGIVDVMQALSHEGYLTADSLSKLAGLEENGKLFGLDLSDILKSDANGFKLAENALKQYIEAIIDYYSVDSSKKFATYEDKLNAIKNYENLRRVLYTLSFTIDEKLREQQKEDLEDQKDALQDQLDAYKKLIDLRKDLLQQYEDELEYKRELEKKEQKVTQLQTQLAVSRLDTTASGRAKTRQLEKDLKDAKEDLDDFTLEHAIEVITNDLDKQYEEYENYINGQIDGIESKIDELTNEENMNFEALKNAITAALGEIDAKIGEINSADTEMPDPANGHPGSMVSPYMVGYQETYDPRPHLSTPNRDEYTGTMTLVKSREAIELEEKILSGEATVKDMTSFLLDKKNRVYHSGGIVKGGEKLKTTETFAKLLKGEFVATPQMMKNFINNTLPSIASSGANVTEINSPLVSIQCDSVTQESIPQLRAIVDEAVKTIKKQLDSGLNRAGYHKTANSIA